MTGHDPTDLEAVYDRIATHFSKTRAYPWSEVTDFLADHSGSVGIDLGCGNGRHLEYLAGSVDRAVGIDLSREILREAASRRRDAGFDADLVRGQATTIPVRSDAVDVALYIATMHHLPTRGARIESLDELARVLRPGGVGLVSVWSTTHDRFDRESGFDAEIDWTLPNGETVPRFYHVYDPEEFERDVKASSLAVVESVVSSGNCFATVSPE